MRISSKMRFWLTGTLGLAAWLTAQAFASGPPPTPPPPANVSSVGVIGEANEPGERLVVSGQVFAPDGVTPVAGITDPAGARARPARRPRPWVRLA